MSEEAERNARILQWLNEHATCIFVGVTDVLWLPTDGTSIEDMILFRIREEQDVSTL